MLRFITVTLAVLAPTVFAFADGWHTESVDTSGEVGKFTSIAVDTSFNPHISYYDDTNDDLRYAYYDGSSWDTGRVDYYGSVGEYTSIALDASDNPHISYYDSTNSDLKYAYYDGSSWQLESVDTTGYVGYCTSIALDASDNPHVSYAASGDLKYAYYDGSAWQVEYADTAMGVGGYTSIGLDTSDDPHISYYDSTNDDLKYAYHDGSSWHIESVDTTGDVGRYTSIALDTSDDPHISYCDYTNEYLKYAYYDGSSWQVEDVDTGQVGFYSSIALDSLDNPHISYLEAMHGYLKYAYYDGSSWQIEVLDTEWGVGSHTSIAVDAFDNPHISYYNGGTEDLKYAFYNVSPTDFDLLSPGDGDTVADAPTLDWEDADDVQQVTYDLWYSEETDFDPHMKVTELTESAYTFDEGALTDGTTYYWKVRAWDGYERTWSGPDDYWSFTVDYELGIRVTSFSAASVADGIEVSWECLDRVAGFNLYRSTGKGEEKAITAREKLNAELITGVSPYAYLDAAVEESITYNYRLEAVDIGGATETFGPVECAWRGALPAAYALYQSRPNPARGTATIAFDLPEDARVALTVYDISGREVTTVVDAAFPAGEHEAGVSGLVPGVYVYKLDAGEFNAVRKMVVVE
jgi:hypothetical protein